MPSRTCPDCHTPMDYRLGMFECPSCGRVEEAAAQEEEQPAGRKFTGVPTPSAPERARASFQDLQSYSLYGVSEPIVRKKETTPLDREKGVFFGLMVTFDLIIAGWLLMSDLIPVYYHILVNIALALVLIAVKLGLLYWVMFNDVFWAKVSMMGLTALAIAGCVVLVIWSPHRYPGMDPLTHGMILAIYCIQGFWFAWFLLILYRDAVREGL